MSAPRSLQLQQSVRMTLFVPTASFSCTGQLHTAVAKGFPKPQQALRSFSFSQERETEINSFRDREGEREENYDRDFINGQYSSCILQKSEHTVKHNFIFCFYPVKLFFSCFKHKFYNLYAFMLEKSYCKYNAKKK